MKNIVIAAVAATALLGFGAGTALAGGACGRACGVHSVTDSTVGADGQRGGGLVSITADGRCHRNCAGQ